MANKGFPISFNFSAFETVSATVDKVNQKFAGLKPGIQDLNNKFAVMESKTKSWRDSIGGLGDKLTGAGKSLSLFATAPLGALAAKMVHTAVEAEETASKFEQVFKNVDEAARNAAVEKLAKGFDLSTASAQEAISTIGLFGKDIGLSEKASLNMGEQLTELAVQVAAFRNVEGGATAASEIFRSAMMGQTKGLKQLGIVIDEADVKTQAQAMAQRGARFESVEQAKALATLALLQKRTLDDQEDFKNSSGELENQTRVLGETFKELSNTFGKILKPVAAALVGILIKVMKALQNLSPTSQKLIVIFGAFVAALGPLLIGLGALVSFIPMIMTGFAALTAIGLPFIGTFALISAAIAAVIAGGVLLVSNWDAIAKFFSGVWDSLVVGLSNFAKHFDPLIDAAHAVLSAWEPVSQFFTNLFGAAEKVFSKLQLSPASFGLANQVAQAQNSPANLGTQAQEMGQAFARELRTTNDARVQVDFANMPRGTRVSSTSSGSPPFLNLGMAMGSPL